MGLPLNSLPQRVFTTEGTLHTLHTSLVLRATPQIITLVHCSPAKQGDNADFKRQRWQTKTTVGTNSLETGAAKFQVWLNSCCSSCQRKIPGELKGEFPSAKIHREIIRTMGGLNHPESAKYTNPNYLKVHIINPKMFQQQKQKFFFSF